MKYRLVLAITLFVLLCQSLSFTANNNLFPPLRQPPATDTVTPSNRQRLRSASDLIDRVNQLE